MQTKNTSAEKVDGVIEKSEDCCRPIFYPQYRLIFSLNEDT